MKTIPTVGDWGTLIYVQILDEDGTPQDIAAANEIVATVQKPKSRNELEITLDPSTDPDHPVAEGWTEFKIPNENWLDEAGLWRVRVRYTDNFVGSWRSGRAAAFRVEG